MIDVSAKGNTLRYARASGVLQAARATLQRVQEGTVPKGDVIATARAAGIAAAKRTSDWIVFCHPIPLDWVEVQVEVADNELRVTAEAKSIWRTGVEMEAMTAVTAALLNVYDMLKPLDQDLMISDIRVDEKRGGKSQFAVTIEPPLKTAVLVISDAKLAGQREDRSGQVIRDFLAEQPVSLDVCENLPADAEQIRQRLLDLVTREKFELVLTTGGTGLRAGDVTPEATASVLARDAPAVVQMLHRHGLERTPRAMVSREVAGVLDQALIVNLPGSSRGAAEALQALFPGVLHICVQLRREKDSDGPIE
jgi:molybdenum cofactor biosynthesis protein MoaC